MTSYAPYADNATIKAFTAASNVFSAHSPSVNPVAMSIIASEITYTNSLVGIFHILSSGALRNCTISSVAAVAPAMDAKYCHVNASVYTTSPVIATPSATPTLNRPIMNITDTTYSNIFFILYSPPLRIFIWMIW